MNKIYRLIWSKKSNSLIAVSEAAKSKRQGTSPSKSKLVGAVAAALLSLSSGIGKAEPVDISHIDTYINNGSIIAEEGSLPGAYGLYNFGRYTEDSYGGYSTANVPTDITNNGDINAHDHGILIEGYGTSGVNNIVNYYPGLANSIVNQGAIVTTNSSIHIEVGNVGPISNAGVIHSISSEGIHVESSTFYCTSSSCATGDLASITPSSTVASISNTGTIVAGADGIYVYDSTITSGIQNIGSYDGPAYTGGIINSGGHGIQLISAEILGGGITNSGLIYAPEAQYFGIYAVSSTISGGIHNIGMYDDGTIVGATVSGALVGALIEGGLHGIYLNDVKLTSGGVTNSGFLQGNGSSGLQIYNSQIVSGSISNSGTIFGAVSGMSMWGTSSLSGSIINSGLIMAYQASLDDRTYGSAMQIRDSTTTISGNIINLAGGRMIARENNDHGINIYGARVDGSIINDGIILAFINHGINIEDSNRVGGILNTGTIASYGGDPTFISGDGGTMTGTFTGDGQGIYIKSSTISGGINNSGINALIIGFKTGLSINNSSTITGSISNSGLIVSGDPGSTVSGGSAILVSGSSAVQGSITNETNAEIVAFESSNHGIEINASTVSGGIINRGTIAAYLNAGVSINNSNYVSGISNTGIIVSLGGSVEAIQTIDGRDASASVGISTTPVGVNIVSSNVGSFANTGSAAGILGLNTGLRLTGTTILGSGTSISNSGTIAGAYTVGVTGAGIKMEASVLNGSLVNSGNILGGTYGLEVETSSILGNISNSGLIQGITGSGIYIANSPTVGSIINALGGTISGQTSGINAYNSQITSITNNGYIESDGYAILSAYNTSVSGNIENNGLISLSDGYGIFNSGTLGSGTLGGSIINRGTINKSDPQSSLGGIGIFNTGSMVGGITNTGSIIMNSGTSSAGNDIGILVQNTFYSNRTPNIFNSGYVYGGTDALAVLSYGGYGFSIVDQIENSGTGILSGGETGIYLGDLYTPAFGVSFSSTIFFPNAYVGSIINRGTIRAEDLYGSGILNDGGTIGGITNSGLIIGGAMGTGIYNMGSIGTILNEGTGRITALGTHVDIYNDPTPNINGQPMGTIDLLINSKGGASPNTPLTFAGRLPTAYQIIVNSTAQYGQLAVTSSSGTMVFDGIYHTSSLTGNHTYEDVITNVGTSNLTGTLSGLFNNRYPWLLSETSYGNWDLITLAPSGPGAIETQSSLRQVANALKSPFVTKNIALNNALNYDCNLFDQHGMCVSLGGAYSQAAGSNTQASSGVVVLGYQFNNQFRVGGYLDQQIQNKNSTAMVSMSDSSPLMGAFAVWNKNANLQGAQVKWSSGYSRHDLSLARPIVDEASEPGSGNTQIKAWGTSLIGSYMVPINDRLSASPYAGIRYSRIKANGYSETFNNDVQTPLTFADLTQKSTAALIGAKLYTQINDRLNILASVGLEHDMSYKGGRYLGTGDVETSAIDFNPNSNQTRMNASIGAYFDVAKKQRIGANIFWTEQPFTDKNSTSLFVNYTLGL